MGNNVIQFMVLIFVVLLVSSSNATLVELSVETDKEVYQLGEDVSVYVTAYNPSSETVTLTFSTNKQATYIMDEIFDYSSVRIYLQIPTSIDIDPQGQHQWTLIHIKDAATAYPLEIGTHSVVGQVVGYGESNSVQFSVIPEPASILLLLAGVPLMKNRIFRKS